MLAMGDTDFTVQQAVAKALNKIGPAPQAAVPTLARALGDPNPIVKQQAAEALGKLGPAAKAVVPLLKRATLNDSPVVRSSAKEALKRISPEWATERRRRIIFGTIAALVLLWALGQLARVAENVSPKPQVSLSEPSSEGVNRSAAPYRIKRGFYGCLTQAALDRAVDLKVNKDEVAFRKLLDTNVCLFLKPDVPVFLDEYDSEHNTVKIRPEGHLGTVWTFGEAIEMVR